jgi:epoxyqueuosine reductase
MPVTSSSPNTSVPTAAKERIAQRARELGFDGCRVTTADAPNSSRQFQQWLSEGRHGEMSYMARNAQKRLDLQRVLPGARSVITLAISYATDEDQPSLPPEQYAIRNTQYGVLARYARFRDYHHIIDERLKQLTQFIDALQSGAKSLWYVDTGPILERDLAQRAGLGFIGKHTNLISRTLGNWIFLAEIITTLELEPDEEEKNRCGSCHRCIAACPTEAITAPFQLDARRCISYLTIELKGSIPLHLRPLIGNRIYGCDDCLAACPWNRFAQEGKMMKPFKRDDLAMADLIELLGMDEAAFRRTFAGTPMERTKRRGLLRNVCVALGNIGDESCLPALERATADPEPLIAEHAAWAIERIKGQMNSNFQAHNPTVALT